MSNTLQFIAVMRLGLVGMLVTFVPMLLARSAAVRVRTRLGRALSGSLGVLITVFFILFSAFTMSFAVMYFTTSLGPEGIFAKYISWISFFFS